MGKALASAPSRQPQTCEVCGKPYSTSSVLRRHIRDVHSSEAAPATPAETAPAAKTATTADGRPVEITTAADLWPDDLVEWVGRNGSLICSVTAVPRVPGVMVSIGLDNGQTVQLEGRTPVRRVIA